MNDAGVRPFSIRALLEDRARYLVPMYQRNYAWGEGEITQLLQDVLVSTGLTARRINILHAYQPLAAMCPSIEPAGQSRHHGARMQGPGGRGCESADIGAHHRPTLLRWQSLLRWKDLAPAAQGKSELVEKLRLPQLMEHGKGRCCRENKKQLKAARLMPWPAPPESASASCPRCQSH